MATLVSPEAAPVTSGSKANTNVNTTEVKDDTVAVERDRLRAGESLKPNQALQSPNGEFRLVLQDDANLCLYAEGGNAIWATDTYRRNATKAVMQPDGNFKLTRDDGRDIWQTDTDGKGNSTSVLLLRDDGNLIITSDGKTIWSANTAQPRKSPKPPKLPRTKADRLEATQTLTTDEFLVSPNGLYRLVLQSDGNLVLYQDKRVLWASDTYRGFGLVNQAILNFDGNLKLLTNNGDEKWSSGTGGQTGGTGALVIQDDGNVVLTWNANTVWSTNTRQRQSSPRTKLDRLEVDQILTTDQALTSPNGMYKLILQGDGNFVLYENTRPLWATKTNTQMGNIRVELRLDGNLVLYVNNSVVWATGTEGRGNAKSVLVLENDGYLALVSDGKEIWSANTRQVQYKPRSNLDRLEVGQVLRPGDSVVSPNKKYKLNMQGDGNFVLYNEADKPLWAAQSNGSERVVMQDDGNLVVFKSGTEVKWSSGTGGRGNATSTLVMQDDGNAVILSGGKRLWASGTRPRLPDRLESGQSIGVGDEIVSPNKTCRMTLQSDGNFTLRQGGQTIWASNTTTGPRANSVTMQGDDNLIVGWRENPNLTSWTSSTRRRIGGGTAILYVRDSGDAIIQSDGLIIWSTNTKLVQPWGLVDLIQVPAGSDRMKVGQYIITGQSMSSSNKQFTVTLQSDGQIVVRRNATSDILWSSGTVYNNVAKLQLNYDNNLILYGTNETQLWSSGTYHVQRFATLIMNNDGDLSIDGLRSNWRTDIQFPVLNGPTDKLQRGQRLADDQALTAGDFKLTFTSLGHLCSTDKTGLSTYYYCEKDIANVKYMIFNRIGQLEFRDDRNNVLATYTMQENKNFDALRQIEFKFHSDGWARMYEDGTELWSIDDLAKGTLPTRSTFNNALYMGFALVVNNEIRSSNQKYKLLMQGDGNLVVIRNKDNRPIWAAGSNGGVRVTMQSDANLVVYRSGGILGTPVWSSRTGGRANGRRTELRMQNNGRAVIFAGDEQIWSTTI